MYRNTAICCCVPNRTGLTERYSKIKNIVASLDSMVQQTCSPRSVGVKIEEDLHWSHSCNRTGISLNQTVSVFSALLSRCWMCMQWLHQVIPTAHKNPQLPSSDKLYTSHFQKSKWNILRDQSHRSHHLFDLKPSGRRCRTMKTNRFETGGFFKIHPNFFNQKAMEGLNTW